MSHALTTPAVVTPVPAPAAPPRTVRLLAVDALRGLALALMALDHTAFFTRASVQAEWNAGEPRVLPGLGWVLTGLMTNMGAPTFWVLSGVSIALMAQAAARNGRPDSEVTRFVLTRALVLLALDLTLIPLMWELRRSFQFGYVFDLLSSLAVSLVLLGLVRRLPRAAVLAVALGMIAAFQTIVPRLPAGAVQWPLAARMWLVFGYGHGSGVPFPVLGWGGLMLLGYAIGPAVTGAAFSRPRAWLVTGTALLALWLTVRLGAAWGSPAAWHPGDPALWWFVMSKGPPGLDFLAFNLALGCFAMAALIPPSRQPQAVPMRWLIRLGKASLFVYAAHVVVYPVLGRLGLHALRYAPVVRVIVVWLAGLALLVPAAGWWRGLKERHPRSLFHYL